MKATLRNIVSLTAVTTLTLALLLISTHVNKNQTGASSFSVTTPSAIQADGSGMPPIKKGGGGGHLNAEPVVADGSGLPPVKGGGGHLNSGPTIADGSGLPPVKGGGGHKQLES